MRCVLYVLSLLVLYIIMEVEKERKSFLQIADWTCVFLQPNSNPVLSNPNGGLNIKLINMKLYLKDLLANACSSIPKDIKGSYRVCAFMSKKHVFLSRTACLTLLHCKRFIHFSTWIVVFKKGRYLPLLISLCRLCGGQRVHCVILYPCDTHESAAC